MDSGDIWVISERDWDVHKALMYIQFEKAIQENRTLLIKLERLKRRQVMRQMAWLNRNLLELDIWVEYASSSDGRAREFWEDSVRDAYSLLTQRKSKKGKKSEKARPLKLPRLLSGEEHDPEFKALMQKAVGILNPDREPDAWTAVTEAAKALGREEEYRSQNQFLSKFVHPTAMSVLLPLPLTSQKNLGMQFAAEGKRLAGSALERLSESHMADMHRKYNSTIEQRKRG